MASVCIVYGSETGNTKSAAEMIAAGLGKSGHTVSLADAAVTGPEFFAAPCDVLLFGVSTWGAVDEEVTEDFKSFYEDMASADLKGRRAAVFGCGDKGYDRFCKAVDFVEQRARERGADLLLPSLKIDRNPAQSTGLVNEWIARLAAAV
ncbi:flavodoxin/nitric oxide synthase [Desulfovibrio sp. X2]|uniref:flavodoxin domain-containing protein n=1 Tax=Desulfovibrio sp. X2 TaxID=941449 RepID=UPI000358EBF9|nr:flavodoxin domain-containing protein [Desulfovibrio sp. X2]EPR44750.1 flavodoxin/nitric oxide synthase [Desulfovibrio sp. X2]